MTDGIKDPFSGGEDSLWVAESNPQSVKPLPVAREKMGTVLNDDSMDAVVEKADISAEARLLEGAEPSPVPPLKFRSDGVPVATDDVVTAIFLIMRGKKGVTDLEAVYAESEEDEGNGYERRKWFLEDEVGNRWHYLLKNLRSRLSHLRRLLGDDAKNPQYIRFSIEHGRRGGRGFNRFWLTPVASEKLMAWVKQQRGVVVD